MGVSAYFQNCASTIHPKLNFRRMKTLNEQTKKKTNEKKKSIEDRMSPIVDTLPYKIYFFGKNTKQRIETHPALTF